jgi:hypothetical protein
LCFETGSSYVVKAGLELMIFLPALPKSLLLIGTT